VFINTDNDQILGAELPDKIVLLVTYCEPGIRGDTATRTLKQATVETGATIGVPLFVNEGESNPGEYKNWRICRESKRIKKLDLLKMGRNHPVLSLFYLILPHFCPNSIKNP
jgi:hypothetical protein